MGRAGAVKNWFYELVFEYETPKIVVIKNLQIGLVYRILQLLVIGYVIGYAIIYDKGYQSSEIGHSTVTTKVKGIASSTHRSAELGGDYSRVWDYADYVIPPMDPNILDGSCIPDVKNCTAGQPVKYGNGVKTGECLPLRINSSTNVCQIETWCPLENDSSPALYQEPLLKGFEEFTIFVKTVVEFPEFKVKRRNVDSVDENYVKNCLYNPKTDNLCPIFKVSDILKLAGADASSISLKGGIVNVLIRWDCNLDYSLSKCIPTFSFSQMDESQNKVSTGFNFRFAHYYRTDGQLTRDLTKAYGILFVFKVNAKAGKFNFVQLSLNIGAGLALLGITSIFMDMLLTQISSDRKFYTDQKFITLTSQTLNEEKMKNSQISTTKSSGQLK